MSEQAPEYRPDIWDGPEGRTIRNQFVDNGYGETIRTVDALRSIDARALGQAALNLYGTSRSYTHERITSTIPGVDDNGENAQIPSALRTIGQDLDLKFVAVEANWMGDAFESASSYNNRLSDVTSLEADRSAVMGDAILDFAVAVEDAVENTEEVVIGAANLLWAEVGFGISLATGGTGGILMSAAGLIAGVSSEVQGEIDRRQTEIEETRLATMDLNKPENIEKVRGIQPEDLMPEFPDDVDDWETS